MRCIIIRQCILPIDTTQVLHQTLSDLQCHYTKNRNHTKESTSTAALVLDILQKNGGLDVANPNYYPSQKQDSNILMVGNQGRYLLYPDNQTKIPSVVLMVTHHTPRNTATNYHTRMKTEKQPINIDRDFDETYNKVSIFTCETTGGVHEEETSGPFNYDSVCGIGHQHENKIKNTFVYDPLGNTSTCLLCKMTNKDVKNSEIVQNMRLFLQPSICTPIVPKTRSGIQIQVHVKTSPQTTNDLSITKVGLRSCKNILRNTGGIATNKEVPWILVAQDVKYTLSVGIQKGTYKLCLYKTEDINIKGYKNSQPICVMLHNFHRLDVLIEEIHHYNLGGKSIPWHVTGMQAVTNYLLINNMVANPIASSKPDHMAFFYQSMDERDMAKVIQLMKLVSDKPKNVKILNNVFSGDVVSHMNIVHRTNDNIADTATDFRIHDSDALKYAIWYQNKDVAAWLCHNKGMDKQEGTAALYSGIAFCHSIAYINLVLHNNTNATLRVDTINETDLPPTKRKQINSMIKRNTDIMSNSVTMWSTIRHNFHVPYEDTEDEKVNAHKDTRISEHALGIQCHVTNDGLIFFRKIEDQHLKFPGAVYVVPSIYSTFQSDMDTSMHNPTITKSTHAIVPLIAQSMSMTTRTKEDLLVNATLMLYYINAICIQKDIDNNHQTKPHQILRNVWLETYVIHASRICKGTGNIDFCILHAHLMNLVALPLDSAGYWATVPYVYQQAKLLFK